mmetsp:Transcript_13382/g.15333  ORF Transcript_13382/g.15333 Transcript_13382/m.15333 type:complete len:93 (-) Transcript_13382:206-484(-)
MPKFSIKDPHDPMTPLAAGNLWDFNEQLEGKLMATQCGGVSFFFVLVGGVKCTTGSGRRRRHYVSLLFSSNRIHIHIHYITTRHHKRHTRGC